MKFTKAIVRKPCKKITEGLKSKNLGHPDYKNAVKQHDRYIKALEKCGLEIEVLEEDGTFPDSVFIEDTAVVTENMAVITNPGAPSRRGEETATLDSLRKYYEKIEKIEPPGTLDGGDVLQVEKTFYIGLSSRTNADGADQLEGILKKHGYEAIRIQLKDLLHLKTGCAYLGDNRLLVAYELKGEPSFQKYEKVEFNKKESYATNCLRINNKVILPQGYPFARKKLSSLEYETITVDVSEFRKLDGGLSCLSLRF
jgi:dimethylargininase